VSLQHEYGIYGGNTGSFILALLRELKKPVITTLHTILNNPSSDQRKVLNEIALLSDQLVTMTETGRRFLLEIYNIPENKISVIPHGIPDIPFVDPNYYKDQFGVEGKNVILTFGLLSPNKGIENVLNALPEVIKKYPNTAYIILGATHPNLIKSEGEAYRLSLERLARSLGIQKNVIFYNRFVDLDELKEFIGAADIYITPYLNEAQITSGTLAYSFGCGKAVISTPYWHAKDLLTDEKGILVPFNNPQKITEAILELLENEPKRHSIRKLAYTTGREMTWNIVASNYLDIFEKARRTKSQRNFKPLSIKSLDEHDEDLPKIKLNHLNSMTDSIGIFQHARYSFPHYDDGYCLDDNARALILSLLLDEVNQSSSNMKKNQLSYAAFINHSFNKEKRRFRNFMSFGREWLEDVGSDDSQGRAIWALGAAAGRSIDSDLQTWAIQLFDKSVSILTELTSPRAWAFGLLGIHEYTNKFKGDRLVSKVRGELVERLVKLYNNVRTEDWCWYEDVLSYDNAKLPHAVIAAAKDMENKELLEIGLKTLEWLMNIQTSEMGLFRPIGSNGFYQKGKERADFDQQPLEAYSTLSACLIAFEITEDEKWYKRAKLSFEWFLGKNDLNIPIYDPYCGGCRDALQIDGVNKNMGAESTLSFLLALTELHLMQNTLHLFRKPNNHSKTENEIFKQSVN
jgi:glycosyltransferase involved in cell wall biosynthesis